MSTSTPPPILQYQTPPQVPSRNGQKCFFFQAAKASWIAPLITFALGGISEGLDQSNRTAYMVLAGFNLTIIVFGFAMAITALCGIRQYGRRGILVPALIGLVINSLILLSGFTVFLVQQMNMRARSTASTQSLTAAQSKQQGNDAFHKYPGWFGVGYSAGATVVLGSTADESPWAAYLRSTVTEKLSFFVISIDNSAGTQEVIFDPRSVQLHFANGNSILASPIGRYCAGSVQERNRAIARFDNLRHVSPRSQLLDAGAMVVPFGTDFRTLENATVLINGQPLVISGSFMSVEQKADLHRRGQEASQGSR